MANARYRWTPSMLDVPFLMGASAATGLTGPSLVRMLTGMGRGESAARNLLTRMVDFGALVAEPHGRTSVYRLGASSQDRYEEVAGTRQEPQWEGWFQALLYSVPESSRTLRDRVMHTATTFGYGLLRPGVLIGVGERAARLNLDPAEFTGEAWLEITRITPSSLAQAQRLARRAWRLEELSQRYRLAATRCEEATARAAQGWDGLKELRDAYAVCFEAQLNDPHLPAVLLPADWPAARFAEAQGAMNGAVGGPLFPFLREQLAAADPGGLNEYYTPPWLAPAP